MKQLITIQQKTKIVSTTVGLMIITSGLIIGLAFALTLFGDTKQTKEPVDSTPSDQESQEPIIETVTIDYRNQIALVATVKNPNELVNLKKEIEQITGNRIFIILSGDPTLNSNEHLLIGRIQEESLNSIRGNPLVTHSMSGFEAQEKSSFTEYGNEQTQQHLEAFKKLTYREELIDRKHNRVLNDDLQTIEETIEELKIEINQDPELSTDEKLEAINQIEIFATEQIEIENDPLKSDKNGWPASDTSIGMRGLILAEQIYVESTPAAGNENWTTAQYNSHHANTWNGLHALATTASDSTNLGFQIIYTGPTNSLNRIPYEPSSDINDSYWIHELMRNRNICAYFVFTCLDTHVSYLPELEKYSEAKANEYGVDQAFVIFSVKDELNPASGGDPAWPHAIYGRYAVTNWSYAWSDYYNQRIAWLDGAVTDHETGHIFYASDQYANASVGCIANHSVAHDRVLAAGENTYHTNKNDDNCIDYQESLMKNSAWSGIYSPAYSTIGAPIIDWHARAQFNWGDSDIIEVLVYNPEQESRTVYVWVDDTYLRILDVDASWTDLVGTANIPVAPGTHTVKIVDTYHQTEGEFQISIPDTNGPGPDNGVYSIAIELGNGCLDGSAPYTCSSSGVFCNGSQLSINTDLCGPMNGYLNYQECRDNDICTTNEDIVANCENQSDCVHLQDGIATCFSSSPTLYGSTSYDFTGDGRKEATCWYASNVDPGWWVNTDYSEVFAQNNGYGWNVSSGDANADPNYNADVGNQGIYNSDYCDASWNPNRPALSASLACACGDDSNEFLTLSSADETSACCDTWNECVINSVCQNYWPTAEICNDGIDNNCNGEVDETSDLDGDGYFSCGPAGEWDCNDNDPTIHPGVPELSWTSEDDNCDGLLNCEDPTVIDDYDEDGYGICSIPTDCNDSDNTIHPQQSEICGNDIDDDCDGKIDERDTECQCENNGGICLFPLKSESCATTDVTQPELEPAVGPQFFCDIGKDCCTPSTPTLE